MLFRSIANVIKGTSFNETIESPDLTEKGFNTERTEVIFNIDDVQENQTETVTYIGADNIPYKVIHRIQNVDNDGYTSEEESKIGRAGAMTEAVARELPGFTVQSFSNVRIGSDGKTEVVIAYNRNYYLLKYDTAGGTYIAPVSLKYGAAVTIPTGSDAPTKLGSTFDGWAGVPGTMPAKDVTVTATWKENTTADYMVVYWKEKVPDENGVSNGYDFVALDSYTSYGRVGCGFHFSQFSYDGF